MFLASKTTPTMTSDHISSTTLPDLSLNISSTSADSNSSGSDLTHENNGLNHVFNNQPKLSLGLEIGGLNYPPTNYHIPMLPLQLQRNSFLLQQHQYENYQHYHHHHHPQIYGHEFKRSSRMGNRVRRIVRAPRMRWTSTLHAHFVHAVQLLGGHESMFFIYLFVINFCLYRLISIALLISHESTLHNICHVFLNHEYVLDSCLSTYCFSAFQLNLHFYIYN